MLIRGSHSLQDREPENPPHVHQAMEDGELQVQPTPVARPAAIRFAPWKATGAGREGLPEGQPQRLESSVGHARGLYPARRWDVLQGTELSVP